MWFTPKEVSPEVGAVMHWLGQRGLIARDGLRPAAWAKAARGTDYRDLALARKGGAPCAVPSHLYEYGGGEIPSCVGEMADRLDLPIDEATATPGGVRLRSGTTWIEETGSGFDLLVSVATHWVDARHVLLTAGPLIALVHRDIEDEARQVLGQIHTLG